MREHEGLTFSLGEYERRLQKVREQMAKRHMDVVIITDPENLAYLTGYQTTGYSYFQALIVPLDKEPFMVARLLESTNVETRTWVEIVRSYTDTGDAIQTVWHALGEFGLQNKVIGFEKDCFFFPTYKQERMHQTIGREAEIMDCSGIVENSRLIKSDEEIQIMRQAARATEAGVKAGVDTVEEGLTENDVAAEIHHAMFKAGGEYPAVAPYVTSGPRCLIGHSTWEGRVIHNHECVFLEVGGCFRRYHTAMMRTVFVGEPPHEMKEAEKLCLEALDSMLHTIRPGITAHDADESARNILSRTTVGGDLLTRSGYSIGIAFAPAWDEGKILSILPGENTVLKKNMTFHLIPWLFGINGGHVLGISETVRVTEDSCESFFSTERRLFQA